MIELPEAVNLADQLNKLVYGKRISDVISKHTPHKLAWYYGEPKEYSNLVVGKTVGKAGAFGSLVEIEVGNTNILFGEGVAARFHKKGEPHPAKHQFLVEFDDNSALSFSVQMYGGVGCFIRGELDNPYYPTMKQFSSLAPYLTAYHKGIVFARPDFAFAANDDVKYKGETLPGNTQVFYSPMLIPVANQHVYEKIYEPMNELMSKIKHIDISDTTQHLQEACFENPVYVALVGDTVMLPQYYYRSPHSDPFTKPKSGVYGTNCPSDFIYGNIDPEPYSLLPHPKEHLENDLWTEFPIAENIVGRITGWDAQDASALIARTVFYDNVISGLG